MGVSLGLVALGVGYVLGPARTTKHAAAGFHFPEPVCAILHGRQHINILDVSQTYQGDTFINISPGLLGTPPRYRRVRRCTSKS